MEQQKKLQVHPVNMMLSASKAFFYMTSSPKPQQLYNQPNWKSPHIPVKAFITPPEEPGGVTFNTLNLTVFDSGLKYGGWGK